MCSALLLMGCQSGTLQLKPSIPQALLIKGQDLPTLEDGTAASMLQNHLKSAEMYYDLRARHSTLVDILMEP